MLSFHLSKEVFQKNIFCQIQIKNDCCDLENFKVKLLIWYEGLGKGNLLTH